MVGVRYGLGYGGCQVWIRVWWEFVGCHVKIAMEII